MKKVLYALLLMGVLSACVSNNQQKQNSELDNTVNNRNEFTRNNIKRITEYEYTYKFGELDLSDKVFQRYKEYDISGNLIEYRLMDYDITKYKYNDTILIEKSSYNIDGSLKNRTTCFYNEDVRIDSVFDSDGIYDGRYVNTFDRMRNIETMTSYEKDGKISSKSTSYGDSIGFYEHRYENFSKYGVNSTITKRTNNDRYRREYTQIDLKSGKLNHNQISYYNDKGQFIKFEKEFSDGRYLGREDIYNDSGLLVKSIFSNMKGVPERESRFTYTYHAVYR